jgi:hypothetical protein
MGYIVFIIVIVVLVAFFTPPREETDQERWERQWSEAQRARNCKMCGGTGHRWDGPCWH